MSGRPVPRFTLAGLLAVAFIAPAVAQEGESATPQAFQTLPVAPMPKAKQQRQIQIELRIGQPNGIELKCTDDKATPQASNGAVVQPPCCRQPAATAVVPVMPQPQRPNLHNYVPQTTNGLEIVPLQPASPAADLSTPPLVLIPSGPLVMPPSSCPFDGPIVGGFGSCPPASPQSIGIGRVVMPPMCTPTPAARSAVVIGRVDCNGVAETTATKETCSSCASAVSTPNPFIGSWHRKIGLYATSITFTHDEMKVRINELDGDKVVCTVIAQYTLTKEGLIYGAITAANVERGSDSKELGDNLSDVLLMAQSFVDHPFSFRLKMTSSGLMISNVKIAAPIENGKPFNVSDFALFGGLYSKDSKVGVVRNVIRGIAIQQVAPAGITITQIPMNAIGVTNGMPPSAGCCNGATGSCPTGGPSTVQPAPNCVGLNLLGALIGEPILPGDCLMPPSSNILPPASVAPPCPAPQPVRPVGRNLPNDSMKQMAVDAFSQLFWRTESTQDVTLPSPRYLQHFPQHFAPDPECAREHAKQEGGEWAARPLAGPAIGGAPCTQERFQFETRQSTTASLSASSEGKPSVVGSWYRELGSRRCVINIAADHMTMTISEAFEEGAETVIGHLIITVEHHLTRDGVTAVGLITGVEMKFEGSMDDEDTKELFKQLGDIQKKLEDKPIAMTFRLYDNSLVIGKVRMPSVDKMDTPVSTFISGRFARTGNNPLPKIKTAKTTEPKPLPVYGPPPASYQPLPGLSPNPDFYQPDIVLPPQGYVIPYPQPTPASKPMARPGACPSSNRPQLIVPPSGAVPVELNKVGLPTGVSEEMPPMSEPTRQMPTPTPPCVSQNGSKIIQGTANCPSAGSTCQENAVSKATGNRFDSWTVSPRIDVPVTNKPAKPGLVGTWYREMGPMMCVLKFDTDHVTLTTYAVGIVNGKEIKEGMILTADYHLGRDGTNMIGQITGLDLLLEGEGHEKNELADIGSGVRELQKAIVDQLFAASFRLYGDTLVIGTFRLPGASGDLSDMQLITGRYKNACDKPLPKPKAMKTKVIELSTTYSTDPTLRIQKVTTTPGNGTLPAVAPAPTSPNCVPSVVPAPAMPKPTLPRTSANDKEKTNSIPTPGPVGLALDFAMPIEKSPSDHQQTFQFGGGVFVDEVAPPMPPPSARVPTMAEPTKPVPQMPQPTPPGVSLKKNGNQSQQRK